MKKTSPTLKKGTTVEKGPLRLTLSRLDCQNEKSQLYRLVFVYFSITNLGVYNHKGQWQLKRQLTFLTEKFVTPIFNTVAGVPPRQSRLFCCTVWRLFSLGRCTCATLFSCLALTAFSCSILTEGKHFQVTFIFHTEESREEPCF